MKGRVFSIMTCLLLAMVACTLASCSEDDGDWEEMKWDTSVKAGKDGVISVGSEGGTYEFKCKNYNPWLCSISQFEDGMEGEVFDRNTDDNRYADQGMYIAGTWLTAKCSDSTLTVEIKPNESQKEHKMTVEVTAGDIFDSFVFRQAGLVAEGK